MDCGPDWQTAADGVFVAGDMHRGASLIVWAIAEGRAAAAGIHRYLDGAGELPAPVEPGRPGVGGRLTGARSSRAVRSCSHAPVGTRTWSRRGRLRTRGPDG